MQNIDNNMGSAIDTLQKSIAQFTEKGELHTTTVPGLSLFRREEPTEPIIQRDITYRLLVGDQGEYLRQIASAGSQASDAGERMDAASAPFQVGYESPSQFNREYNRLFVAPPLRDITRGHDNLA
jgi:AraC-like DNA-binding protein